MVHRSFLFTRTLIARFEALKKAYIDAKGIKLSLSDIVMAAVEAKLDQIESELKDSAS